MRASASIAASIVLALVAVGCASDPTSPGTTAGSEPGSLHVVLDTDLAFDDIMALLYLLRREDVVLDAVTLAGTGEAHCDPGVPGMATWREEPLVVATGLPATQGQLHVSDEGAPTRFASVVPDPLAFEREFLTTLTASDVTAVRPDPTMTIRFDGERCSVEPTSISAGNHDVAFVSSAPGDTFAVAVVLRTNVGLSYAELRTLLGAQGSTLPSDDPALGRIEQIAEVRTMTPVEIAAGTIVAVCAVFEERGAVPKVWLGDEFAVEES